jgi:activating signal cointegrator complex subunit 2
MSSSAEPPPKKRKLVDAQSRSPSSTPVLAPASAQLPSLYPPHSAAPPETLAAAAPTSAPPPPEETPLSEERAAQKRRNREELCRIYECYRRIRSFIDSKDASVLPQLEQDYLLLISGSRGVQTTFLSSLYRDAMQ